MTSRESASTGNFFGNVLKLWKTELEVAWNWPGGRFRLIRNLIGHILIGGLALWLIVFLIPGISLENFWSSFVTMAAASFLAVAVRPVIFLLVRGHDYLTILVTLTIDFVTLLVIDLFEVGLAIDSILAAVVTALLLTIVSVIIDTLLNIDRSEMFYRNVILNMVRQNARTSDSDEPGVVIIQIDGLSAPIIRFAVRTGQMPFVASWVRGGSHRLYDWECALPSMTSASQAGILHGNNFDIPAFRWYEKDRRKLMVSNHAKDAAELESRLTGEHDLLANGGTSISNLLSGGAAKALVTTSRLGSRSDRPESITVNLASYLSRPNTALRLITLTGNEVVKEWMQAWRQRRHGIDPRMFRGGIFPLLRASTTVIMPDLITELIIEEMERGTPVIYADVLSYDEVAHHAGPERPEALDELQDIDQLIRTLSRAAERTRKPYEFVILSDHGQSQGATFEDRFGVSLQSLVKSFVGGDVDVVAELDNAESWSTVNAMGNQLAQEAGAAGAVTSQLTKGHQSEGYVNFGPQRADASGDGKPVDDVVVTASGNLALIYFNASPQRITFEAIEGLYPGLVAGLAAHEGISFVMVESERFGPIVMGNRGVRRLADGVVEGDDPLAPFGPNVPAHLQRLSTFPHVGDIVVNSLVDAETEEVAPFEVLIGCHGGLGGPQTSPFLLIPADWEAPPQPIVGSESLNGLLRGSIDDLRPAAGANAEAP